MSAEINKELTLKIAKKLGAIIEDKPHRSHDIAKVFHKGKLICIFGIRRGSNKELGHDHIPGQIFSKTRDARLLGQCPRTREDWINELKEKRKIL